MTDDQGSSSVKVLAFPTGPMWVGTSVRSVAATAAFGRWEAALEELVTANRQLEVLAATEGEWKWPNGRRYFDACGLRMAERVQEAGESLLRAIADEDDLN